MSPDPKPSFQQAPKWDLASLVDREVVIELDRHKSADDLKRRDRMIYLEVLRIHGLTAPPSNSSGAVLRHWIEAIRRSEDFPQPSPGETLEDLYGVVKILGTLACVVAGFMFAWGALAIAGRQVNVILLWCLIVGLPLGMTVFGAYLLFWGKLRGMNGVGGVLRSLLARLLVSMGSQTAVFVRREVSQEQADWVGRQYGRIRRSFHGRGAALTLYFESLAHYLGLGAVTGIFIAILTFRLFSFQDYGWQTHTGSITEGRLHSVVGAIAVPWSWFAADGAGYPTISQIHDTRIFRNQPQSKSNPDASNTWSSFLLWSSVFYGLLPRMALCIAGGIRLRRAIDLVGHEKFDALWRRMTVPDVVITSPDEPDIPATEPFAGHPVVSENSGVSSVLLIPSKLDTSTIVDTIRGRLRVEGIGFDKVELLPSLPTERQQLADSLAASSVRPPSRILVVQESHMPPNQSFERLITKTFQKTCGDSVQIHVILMHDDHVPHASQYLDAWKGRLYRGNPFIHLHTVPFNPTNDPRSL